MRIIAGKFKGQRLEAAKGIRPTSSQVREAVMNILRNELPGATFIDLFAGSGAVGLEALSQGAARCIFVDSGPRGVQQALSRNCRRLGAGETGRTIHRPVGRVNLLPGQRGSIVWADPPYPTAVADLTQVFERWETFAKAPAVLCFEAPWSAASDLERAIPPWTQGRVHRYGDSLIWVLTMRKE